MIRHILKNPSDESRMALIFANQTEADILLRQELEEAAAEHPDRLRIWYTVDRPVDGNTKISTKIFSKLINDWAR